MVDILAISKRLQARPDWQAIEPIRTRMMRECRQDRNMSHDEAQQWTYGELDRRYPPEQPPNIVSGSGVSNPEPGGESHARTREGLGGIPPGWPDLPPNASLQAEIAWVQAERLRIVTELPSGKIKVNLELARAPAPSWSALSWLETSIRSYAKYVEVAAKAAATEQGEQDQVRRERLDIEDVRALLAEMQ